jgi:uncharacterized RDD family membrane protein YckC
MSSAATDQPGSVHGLLVGFAVVRDRTGRPWAEFVGAASRTAWHHAVVHVADTPADRAPLVTAHDPTSVVGRRCLQFALDRLVVLVPLCLLGWLGAWLLLPTNSLHALVVFAMTELIILFVLGVVSLLALEIWWPYRHGGQTPAMRWLGLRIVRTDSGQLALRDYLLRTLLLVVDGFLWGLVGLALMLISRRHQRLGDLVVNAVVVRVGKD